MIKSLLVLFFAVSSVAAQAEIVNCPKNGRPYDTDHGYYVDNPRSRYYVAPRDRAPAQRGSSTIAVPARWRY